MRLPVIVGFGGVNAAGRSSFHHGYRRMIISELNADHRMSTLASLGQLMGLDPAERGFEAEVMSGTLVRRIEAPLLDVTNVDYNHLIKTSSDSDALTVFELDIKHLPSDVPDNWQVKTRSDGKARVTIEGRQTLLIPSTRELPVKSAGQLPSGFEPGSLYQSRNHPRGLQMTVYGASDAIQSVGIPWEKITASVAPDQISVYAGSGMSQLDLNGNGGMLSARYKGKRVTSKQCPLGFAEMPADFINAYVLGGLGTTGTNMGACASFLYNLRQGMMDIRQGLSRVAIVGSSEAPITPEVIEGYAAMGALATDKELRELDDGTLDHHRACRPFGDNCGFTLAESAQFVVLFDAELALELGASIHGAVSDVFINADGHKKSISAPGVGNYLTVARALASIRSLLGEASVSNRSFVQAHGTGTPQNRVTESDVLNSVARQFGIQSWPVVAVKNYLGHSIGAAGADQLIASLGVWNDGVLPGITSIDGPADDVHSSHLHISREHKEIGIEAMDSAVINAKGFGGNNASAVVLSPGVTCHMLERKFGKTAWQQYQKKSDPVRAAAIRYDEAMTKGEASPIYKFDHNVMGGADLDLTGSAISIPGFGQPIDLTVESHYKDWLE